MKKFTRRDWLTLALGTLASRHLAADNKVRIGFVGVGSRGTALLRNILNFPDVEVPVICDIDERALNRALDIVQKERGYRPEGFSRGSEDYRRMYARSDYRAVLIATPQEWHARMSADAFKAGKFVGSEVPACTTLDECWDLVRTQEKTRSGYMLLENYRYSRFAMQVLNMARQGAFGELTYAECAYIHETRGMRFNPDGSMTWRGHNIAENIGDLYPTHSIGPVCQWMDVNRTDRLVSMVTMASKPAAMHEWAERKFGKNSEQAKIRFLNGDSNNTMVRTQQGRLILIRYDVVSPRPHGMGQYSLQGTRGCYSSAFGQHNVYLEGRTRELKWEPLEKYQSEYDHAYWGQRGAEANKTGHGGGDYFVLSDFIEAIRSGESPIDVYDAVTWSAIRPLSAVSLKGGSVPVAIPDFKKGA